MRSYEEIVKLELEKWHREMMKRPSFLGRYTKKLQKRMNGILPETLHQMLTKSIKNMVHAALIGSQYTTGKHPSAGLTLEEREKLVRDRLNFYKKAAAAEGAGTGAGGIFLGLADFPLLLSMKMKALFDIASIYGFDVKDYRERLYILHLFQLAFSGEERRREVYQHILLWDETLKRFPPDNNLEGIDWRVFQQEYRDYIDLVKMLQLIPGIGAVVGAFANYRLLDTLGETAMNGYRLRIF